MCVVALLLGILMADMLQNVCGCKDIVEGLGAVPPNSVGPPCYQIHDPTPCDSATYKGGGECLGGHIVQDWVKYYPGPCMAAIDQLRQGEPATRECPFPYPLTSASWVVRPGAEKCFKRAAPTATAQAQAQSQAQAQAGAPPICNTGRCKLTFDPAGVATIDLNDCVE